MLISANCAPGLAGADTPEPPASTLAPHPLSQMTTLDVNWTAPTSITDGVEKIGYANGALIGLNGILLGALVALQDPTGVYQRKWEALRRSRLCEEQNLLERAWGVRMQKWKEGPWRITYITPISFGVTLETEKDINQYDLLVRPDTVTPWDDQ